MIAALLIATTEVMGLCFTEPQGGSIGFLKTTCWTQLVAVNVAASGMF